MRNVYIGSCVENGGICRYVLSEEGELCHIEKFALDRPMYMALEGDALYAVTMQSFPEGSGFLRISLNESGSLCKAAGPMQPTHGVEACHILVAGEDVYIANYGSGNVVKLPDTLARQEGHSVNLERQDGPHTHQAVLTPDGKRVCVMDLGLDKILLYDRDLRYTGAASLSAGKGPRHMVFSPDGVFAYCVNELSSDVSVFRYCDGTLHYLHSIAALPENRAKNSYAAAIRISKKGDYLYVSNRGDDSISCFSVQGEQLLLTAVVPCGGCWPRDFILTPEEEFLLVANERSNNVAVFVLREGIPSLLNDSCRLKKPLCLVCR